MRSRISHLLYVYICNHLDNFSTEAPEDPWVNIDPSLRIKDEDQIINLLYLIRTVNLARFINNSWQISLLFKNALLEHFKKVEGILNPNIDLSEYFSWFCSTRDFRYNDVFRLVDSVEDSFANEAILSQITERNVKRQSRKSLTGKLFC